MQINEPLQNLACPALNGSDIDSPIFLSVSAEEEGLSLTIRLNRTIVKDMDQNLLSERSRSKQFSNEVEGFAINVDPRGVESHDRFMLKCAK